MAEPGIIRSDHQATRLAIVKVYEYYPINCNVYNADFFTGFPLFNKKIGVTGHHALCMTSLQKSKQLSDYHEIWNVSSTIKDVSKQAFVRSTKQRDGGVNKIA
jgi:hypothetical protein